MTRLSARGESTVRRMPEDSGVPRPLSLRKTRERDREIHSRHAAVRIVYSGGNGAIRVVAYLMGREREAPSRT
jgi:hypothetical protein